MSQTYSIVCHETKEKLWIEQGTGGMPRLYTSEPETMEALHWFLVKNRAHSFNMVYEGRDWGCVNYACWSGVHCDWRIKEDGIDLGVFSGTLPQAVKEATGEYHHYFPSNIEYGMVEKESGEGKEKRVPQAVRCPLSWLIETGPKSQLL